MIFCFLFSTKTKEMTDATWARSLDTIKEMLEDRGYTIWLEVGPVSVCSTKDLQSHIMVYMCQSDKFNIEGVKYAIYHLQQHKLKHIIIIYQNIVTSSAKKAIEHLQDYTIELFEKKELQFNPTKHRLYSPHIKLDKNTPEVPHDQLNNLPVLLRTDVIARYFHFHRGDIIKINRINGSIAYRLVK